MVDSLPFRHRHLRQSMRVIVATTVGTGQSIASVLHQVFQTVGTWMALMDETMSILVPANVIDETVAAAEADHMGTTDGIDEALEMITTGITLEVDDTIGAGPEATAESAAEAAAVAVVIVLETALETDLAIVLGIDHAVGQGTDQDPVVGRGIDLTSDQETRDVIAQEIDPVIVLSLETDPGIDRIGLVTAVERDTIVPVLNVAEVPALILAKIVLEMLPMAEVQRMAMEKRAIRPTGVRSREIMSLEGDAVEAEVVGEAERNEKRVVTSVAEVAQLVLLTTQRSEEGKTLKRFRRKPCGLFNKSYLARIVSPKCKA